MSDTYIGVAPAPIRQARIERLVKTATHVLSWQRGMNNIAERKNEALKWASDAVKIVASGGAFKSLAEEKANRVY